MKSLKSKFGKVDLLVEDYVRELLKLALLIVLKKQSEISFQSLYDKLEWHLPAIDSLGVTMRNVLRGCFLWLSRVCYKLGSEVHFITEMKQNLV